GYRDYDARRDDARVARPYGTRARRRPAHDGDLCHDHARCSLAPDGAVAWRALCFGAVTFRRRVVWGSRRIRAVLLSAADPSAGWPRRRAADLNFRSKPISYAKRPALGRVESLEQIWRR